MDILFKKSLKKHVINNPGGSRWLRPLNKTSLLGVIHLKVYTIKWCYLGLQVKVEHLCCIEYETPKFSLLHWSWWCCVLCPLPYLLISRRFGQWNVDCHCQKGYSGRIMKRGVIKIAVRGVSGHWDVCVRSSWHTCGASQFKLFLVRRDQHRYISANVGGLSSNYDSTLIKGRSSDRFSKKNIRTWHIANV